MSRKKFKNVLVVLGGTSGERAVSLESGKACAKALRKKGYKVLEFDPKFKNFNLIDKKYTDVFLMLFMEETVKMVLHRVILNI